MFHIVSCMPPVRFADWCGFACLTQFPQQPPPPPPPAPTGVKVVLKKCMRVLNVVVAMGVVGVIAAASLPEIIAQLEERKKELARRDKRLAQMKSRNRKAKVKSAETAHRNRMGMGS